ncbi:hypothetical protein NUBL17190_09750 [Klebsiella pneumoniae]|nr:hypothetical protein NUBL17190_09750 [Klebsiella pneumoniae]HCI8725852.1 hypothetical protein [Klebsiella pneumoniae]HDU4456153.1 hypothetical protein [Klebsiella pneumoniae subsp. pneumoniae]HDU6080605.1 hypothetical protein [Klebsiella pneumoniae subsp. pneumoniae]
MTDITELAQREKFEAWFKSSFHPDKTGPYIKDQLYFAWKAAGAELVEALEKAQSANECLREQSAEWERKAISNFEYCAEMSARIEELESQRKLAFTASNRWADKFREAEKRIAELESRTVKLPDDEDGQAYGFGKWANRKLPATAGTMTIAYCEDAWRAAFEVFSSAAGINVEAE